VTLKTFNRKVAKVGRPRAIHLKIKPDGWYHVRPRALGASDPQMNKPPTKRKIAFRISPAIEKRIADLSLQNPDFDTVMLLRLRQQEKIDPSIRAVEAMRPQLEKPLPVPPQKAEKSSHHGMLPVSKEQTGTRLCGYFGWMVLNILLLVLLANTGLNVVRNGLSRMHEPGSVKVAAPSSIDLWPVAAELAAPSPLYDYRMIWERNLFNISKKEAPVSETEPGIEKVALAEINLGLRLIGTVVADDPSMNRALIDDLNARAQGIYSEGSRAGRVRIKKVLRNKVIIETAEGDRLLAVDFGGAVGSSDPEAPAQPAVASRTYPQRVAGRRPPGKSILLARAQIEASLADIGELEQQLNLTAYVKNDQPAGFIIGNIPRQSILRKMGLKNSDAVMAVNSEVITGPDQAEAFFQMLKQGGNMTVKVRKGRGVRRRTRNIYLDIY
jgi:type II secretion system protein C